MLIENWELIVATCYWAGSCNRILSAEARERVWEQGDGYGRMTRAQLAELGLMEDWSHIRDSSDEAQQRMADQIRRELGEDLSVVAMIVERIGIRTFT